MIVTVFVVMLRCSGVWGWAVGLVAALGPLHRQNEIIVLSLYLVFRAVDVW